MTDGYVDAGRLEAKVVADTKGLAAELRTKLAAATKGIDATIGTKVDTKALKKQLKDATRDAAGAETSVTVKADTRDLKKQIKDAAKAIAGVQAKIGIKADASTLNRQLKDAASAAAARVEAVIGVKADTRALRRQIRDAAKAITGIEATIGVKVDAAGIQARLNAAAAGGKYTLPVRLKVSMVGVQTQINALTRGRNRLTVKVTPDVDTDALRRKVKNAGPMGGQGGGGPAGPLGGLAGAAGGAARGLSGVALPAALAGAVPIVAGLAGALAALAGAIGPVVYNLGLLPAAGAAGAAGIGALVVGFQGLGEAMKAIGEKDLGKFQESLKGLSPAAREVATAFAEIQPTLTAFRKQVQESLLKGMAGPLKTLAGQYLGKGGVLRRALDGTAKAWNNAFSQTAGFLSSATTVKLLSGGMTEVVRTSDQLSRTMKPVASIFTDLFVAGAPFITRMAKGIADMTGRLAAFISRSRESGALTAAFERGFSVAKQLGRIIRDLSVGLYNFFSAGQSTGQGFLTSLEQMMARFRAFTSSVAGQTAMRKFYDTTKAVMGGVAALIGFVVRAAGALWSAFQALPAPVQAVVGPLLLLAGGAALLLTKLGPLIGVLARIGPAIAAIGGASTLGTIAAIAAPIALLAGAFLYAYTQVESFRNLVSEAFSTVGYIVSSAWQTVSPIFTMMGAIFSDTIKPAIDSVIATISEKFMPVLATMRQVYDEHVKPALEGLTAKFQEAEPEIRKVVEWVTNLVKMLAERVDFTPFQTAIEAVGWAFETVGDQAETMISGFQALVQYWETIPGRLRSLAASIGTFYDNLPGPVRWALEKTGGDKIAKGAQKTISDLAGAGEQIMKPPKPGPRDKALEAAKKAAKKKPPPAPKPAPKPAWLAEFEKLSGGKGDVAAGPAYAGWTNKAADAAAVKANAAREKAEREAAKRAEAVRNAVQAMANKGFLTGLTSTIAGIRTAARQMVGFAKTALGKGALPLTERIYADTNRLTALAARRDVIVKTLTAAQDRLRKLTEQAGQTRQQIADTIRGTFNLLDDAATQGAQAMIDRLSKAVEAARTFTASIATLKARGLNSALLGQLAGGGPAAQGTADTLTKATGEELAKINSLYTDLDRQAQTGGKIVADALYGAGIQAAQGLVNGLLAQRKAIEATMLTIATALQGAIKVALKIKSPSQVMVAMGGDTMAGLRSGLMGPTTGITGSLTKWATDTMTTVKGAFRTGVTGIAAAWGGLVEASKSPVRTVIDLAINKGIVAAFNAVAIQFGVKGITPFAVPKALMATQPVKRATGGPVFGAGTATSDSVPALLSTGEHVLAAREVTGLGGHGAVEAIRAAARRSGTGFAAGGGLSGSGPATYPSMVDWLKKNFPAARAGTYQPSFGYHRSAPGGYAADIFAPEVGSGGAPAMAVFEGIRRTFKKHIQELIYTWAGPRQVWGGKDHTFTGGALQASHRTHIHWSMLADGFSGGVAAALANPVTEGVAKAVAAIKGSAAVQSPFGKMVLAGAQKLGAVVAPAAEGKLYGETVLAGDPKGVPVPKGTDLSGLPGSVTRWAPTVLAVLRVLRQPESNLGAVLRRINLESTGDPNAINLYDSNARAGHPSQGLIQTIPTTFAAHAGPYAARGITDPFANIYAGLHYAIGRYGSIAAIDPLVRPFGYDRGGLLPVGTTLVRNDTGRPEPVMPGRTFDRLVSALEQTAGPARPQVIGPGASANLGMRPLASMTVPGQRTAAAPAAPAAGTVINVYPRATQSEAEIARGVSRELAWQGTPW